MKRIQLKGKAFKGLDGEYLKDAEGEKVLMGKTIGNMLVGGANTDKNKIAKHYSLALRFYEGVNFDLDDSDIETSEDAIAKVQNWSDLVKAQALSLLKEAKEAKK